MFFRLQKYRYAMKTNSPSELPLSTRISMYTAFIGGIITPTLETVRRWRQIPDPHYFIAWFDDYLIGGFLLFAAWKTFKDHVNGYRFLIAAWGFATGMAFYSFFGQLQRIDQPDPSQVSSAIVVMIKGFMFAICILCLFFSLQNPAKHKVDGSN